MNREKIIAEASNIFSNLNTVKENVYKGQLLIDEKPAGLYFLDLHGDVKAEEFKNFQEEILSEEFYNQNNELQWNMYFILIMDTVDTKDKQTIESDEKYARKYVFTENEFLDFFTLDKNTATIQSDIVSEWKKKLDEVDLQEVYGNETYVDGVARFINNKTLKVSTVKQTKQTTEVLKINFINKIILKNEYRPHPIIRQFEFGKVNLFKGPNGVGKTSTLEALEMIVCGRTFRNPNTYEKENCIQAILNNAIIEDYTPSKKEKYRARDEQWYNNANTKDNSLYRSFNRFNFFDSDAANNFSQSNNEAAIRQALENLVLGGEFKYLKDRVNGFYTRLRPELNKSSTLMREYKEKIIHADHVLKNKKNDDIASIIQEINRRLGFLDFVSPVVFQQDNLSSIDILVNQISSIITRIQNSNNEFKSSEKVVGQRLEIINKRIALFNTFSSEFSSITKTLSEKEFLVNVFSSQIQILQTCVEILDNPRLLQLDNLYQKISLATAEVQKIHQIEQNLISISYLTLSESDTLNNILVEGRKSASLLKVQISELSSQINERLQLLGSIERLIKDVKNKGVEILNMDETIEDCPLCNTHLGRDELLKQINILISSFDGNHDDSKELVETRIALENQLKAIELKVDKVQTIKNNYEELFNKSCNDINLSQCIDEIEKFYLNKSTFESNLSELKSLEIYGNNHSLNEDKLRELKANLNTLFSGKFQLVIEQKDYFIQELKVLREKNSEEEKQINALIEERDRLAQNIKVNLELPIDQPFKQRDILLELESEQAELISLAQNYADLKKILNFTPEELIENLKSKIDIISKNLASLKSSIAANYEISEAKKNKEDGEKYVKQNAENLKRLQRGVDLLENLNNTGGTSELSTFFNSNFSQILEVFKTIHSPREFVDLKYEDGEVLLITRLGENRRVSQISTGQRAALALSIFISMNRMSKKGPKIIVFDDPISHVDDLNALSFLDFLRIFILREKKQIFFASANSRLSSLFQKKFEFLGNDFRQWELKRESTPLA